MFIFMVFFLSFHVLGDDGTYKPKVRDLVTRDLLQGICDVTAGAWGKKF